MGLSGSGTWNCGDNKICKAIETMSFFGCQDDKDCMAITALDRKSIKLFCESSDCKALLGLTGGFCSDTSSSNCRHMVDKNPTGCQELGERVTESKKSELESFDFNAIIPTTKVDSTQIDMQRRQQMQSNTIYTNSDSHQQIKKNKCCVNCSCTIL